ncbi:MAG: PGPGW domain-containing protein [Nitrosomonas sp.]|uniref:PGPGW domain-containing protein n=1 Tax=Nitrosomonas sp. TaxID=42353 RepID=UPI0027367F7B|nr:PGPGW domain-containing protein [Nitrosomonas sp.]MDP3281645.1 PGPGW domain-containing protein [Nitrosomonas sp.]MDP3661869.1 PGPGW domain-containing protein [Nitrosomonas sp.]MDZ4106653.1 PGPGW domain-containing protein [Nitrosomonas sp.]
MEDIIVIIQQWVPINILVGLTAASVIGFIGSLIAIPWILIRLPSDYFDMRVPRYWMKDHHPVLRTIGRIVKNIAGSIFLIAGFFMLFLPGQGLLTMLIGISFMDFPNKRKLEARIVGQPVFFKAINAMRQKFNKLPLTLSPSSD